jgi:putative transposase
MRETKGSGMIMTGESYSGSHSAYKLAVHLVFVTKHRSKLFKIEHIARLNEIFIDICMNIEVRLVERTGNRIMHVC